MAFLDHSPDDNAIVRGHALHQSIRIDPSSAAPIYVGWADPGAPETAPLWRICRFTYSGPDITEVKWADGDIHYDNVWTNRAALPYL